MKFYKEMYGEDFKFRKSGLKIAGGTFAGPGCHYNDCCLRANVKNKTSGEKRPFIFPMFCFEVSDPFKPYDS